MFARIFNHNYRVGVVTQDVSIYRHHNKQMHKSAEKIKNNKKLQKIVIQKIKNRKYNLNGLRRLS